MLPRAVLRKDRRLHGTVARDLREPPVLRIEVEEQSIADIELPRRQRAAGRKGDHGIAAVAVAVDELIVHRPHATLAVRRQVEPGKGIRCDVGMAPPHLAPADHPVLVGIQAEGEIEVPQRDVPLPAKLRSRHTDTQVTVARLVRRGRRGERGENERGKALQQRRRASRMRHERRAPWYPPWYGRASSLDASGCRTCPGGGRNEARMARYRRNWDRKQANGDRMAVRSGRSAAW